MRKTPPKATPRKSKWSIANLHMPADPLLAWRYQLDGTGFVTLTQFATEFPDRVAIATSSLIQVFSVAIFAVVVVGTLFLLCTMTGRGVAALANTRPRSRNKRLFALEIARNQRRSRRFGRVFAIVGAIGGSLFALLAGSINPLAGSGIVALLFAAAYAMFAAEMRALLGTFFVDSSDVLFLGASVRIHQGTLDVSGIIREIRWFHLVIEATDDRGVLTRHFVNAGVALTYIAVVVPRAHCNPPNGIVVRDNTHVL